MLAVFFSYVGYVWTKYGVQKSISQSYYALPDKLKPLMTFFCVGFAVPAMILGSSSLMFLAGAGICFVGVAAAFQKTMAHNVHMIGAGVGVAASQLAIAFQYEMWPITATFVGGSLVIVLLEWLLNKERKAFLLEPINTRIWWIEILAFVSICFVLAIEIIAKAIAVAIGSIGS